MKFRVSLKESGCSACFDRPSMGKRWLELCVAASIFLILSLSKDARMVFQSQSTFNSFRVAKRLDRYPASFDKLRMGALVGSSGIQHGGSR
jgi:hypothetical protein